MQLSSANESLTAFSFAGILKIDTKTALVQFFEILHFELLPRLSIYSRTLS